MLRNKLTRLFSRYAHDCIFINQRLRERKLNVPCVKLAEGRVTLRWLAHHISSTNGVCSFLKIMPSCEEWPFQ